MEKIVTLTKEQEGQYIKIPFDVPAGIEKMMIEYEYPKNETIIDFGLYGTDGFIGASGSNRKSIQISSKSDPGFQNVTIEAGTWHIIVGAYKVEDSEVDVTYRIDFVEKERMLLNGDTHTHTLSSDGSYSYPELIEKAEKEGLDFLIVTDHNNFAQNDRITGREKIVVIPGTEWTLYNGHANFIGAKQAIADPFDVTTVEGVNDKVEKGRENGALVSVNHPFCPNCGWQWGLSETDFDLIEIWNGALPQTSNLKALAWWDDQLKAGKKISAIAGSDFHKVEGFRNLGQPLTRVWTDSKEESILIKAIADGHTFMSYALNAPTILIESSDGIQGDMVADTIALLTLEKLYAGDTVHLISDKGKQVIEIEKNYEEFKLAHDCAAFLYLRVEIYRPVINETLKMPVSLSNPIYFD